MKKAHMDTIITEAPHKGGTYFFTNHKEIKTVDEKTGEERISYEADAEWVADENRQVENP